MTDWTNAEERLPPNGEVVLVWGYHEDGTCDNDFCLAVLQYKQGWIAYPGLDHMRVKAWKTIEGPNGQKVGLRDVDKDRK